MNIIKKSVIAVAMFCGAAATTYAASGDVTVGANLGVSPTLSNNWDASNFTLGLKVQYGFTDDVRGEFNFENGFNSSHLSYYELMANVHYIIPVSQVFSMYPIVGIGYGHTKIDAYVGDVNFNRFAINAGLGGEFRLTDNLSAQVEVKYLYMKDFSRMPMTFGVTYKF